MDMIWWTWYDRHGTVDMVRWQWYNEQGTMDFAKRSMGLAMATLSYIYCMGLAMAMDLDSMAMDLDSMALIMGAVPRLSGLELTPNGRSGRFAPSPHPRTALHLTFSSW